MASVLVFDSGVGGLSVLSDIRRLRPDLDYYYVLDNAAFPYGLLASDTLISRVTTLITELVARHMPQLVVIACNTASTIVLPTLREHLSIPVVGVVPAIKPAAQLTETGCIGLLATPATVARSYIDDLISTHAAHCNVERLGTTRLVSLAEQQIRGEAVCQQTLADELAPWLAHKHLDTLVLGCTHFPLLRHQLQQCLPQVKHWVDSGEAIARRVDSLIPIKEQRIGEGRWVYCTQESDAFKRLWPAMTADYGFGHWQVASAEQKSDPVAD